MNWLHGKPTTVNPRGPYSSCSASSCVYCGVNPQRLATFTTSAGLPPVSAPKVVCSPCSVVTGASRRSLMPPPASGRAGSFQAADVVRHVDGVLAQRLQRHHLQRPGVGRRQDDAGRLPGLVGLQPPGGDDAPAVARPQPGEGELGSRGGQVVAQVPLQREEL